MGRADVKETNPMTRMGLIVLCAVATLAAPVALAQDAPDNEDSRFTFHRTADGYLRLEIGRAHV